jgi:hypothetical protein
VHRQIWFDTNINRDFQIMIRKNGCHAGFFSASLAETPPLSRATLAQKQHLGEEVGKRSKKEEWSHRGNSFTLLHATCSGGESADPKYVPVQVANLDTLAITSITPCTHGRPTGSYFHVRRNPGSITKLTTRTTRSFSHTQYDIQGSYRLGKGFETVAYGLNLSNEIFGFYQDSTIWPIQREFYHPTVSVGVRWHLGAD